MWFSVCTHLAPMLGNTKLGQHKGSTFLVASSQVICLLCARKLKAVLQDCLHCLAKANGTNTSLVKVLADSQVICLAGMN